MPRVDTRHNPNMRGTTHWDGCWREEHPECAQRLLERWWPVIEAAQRWKQIRDETFAGYINRDDYSAVNNALDATITAALKEGNADGT